MSENIKTIISNGLFAKFEIRPNSTDARVIDENWVDSQYFKTHCRVKPGDNVVDIGAHIGSFAILAAKMGASCVICYEPLPQSFELLTRNARMNSDRIVCYNKAVMAQDGVVRLSSPRAPSELISEHRHEWAGLVNTGATHVITEHEETDHDVIDVPAIAATHVLGASSSRIDFLKLDCEGSEYQILESLTDEQLMSIRDIVCEFHHGIDKGVVVADRFRRLGFTVSFALSEPEADYGVICAHREQSLYSPLMTDESFLLNFERLYDGASIEGWCPLSKAKTLAKFILDAKAEYCVELGVFGGSSFIPQAMALKQLGRGRAYGIDPWSREAVLEGMVDPRNIEWWGSKVNLEQIYAKCVAAIAVRGLAEYCTLLRNKSADVHHMFAPESIDLLHIDGNHSRITSLADAVNYLPKVKRGGLIVFDDIHWNDGGDLPTQTAVQYLLSSGCVVIDTQIDCAFLRKE